MNVCDSPVSVVAQSIDGFDGHHRTFEGRHTVEGKRDDQEFQDRVGTQLVSCAGQGHDTVDHTAPRRCEQNQGQHHTQGLSPVRQRGIVQVVGTCPHVSKNQSPEVDNGQAVRVNRTTCLFRHKVIHHAQETCCQEETYGIVAIPPLNHRIDCTGVNRVRFHQTGRDADVIDDVQQCDSQDEAAVEPVGNDYEIGSASCRERV